MKQTSATMTSPDAKELYQFIKLNNLQIDQHGNTSNFVVALSGGLDSMVMLRLMLELRYQFDIQFSAIHVHHGLSVNADNWQRSVEKYCEINQISLQSHKLSLEKTPQRSLEQIARDARYEVFAETLPSSTFVFTGHHLQDQMETFFLRLARGSGSKGLASMTAVSDLPNHQGKHKQIKLVRPLLSLSKGQLQSYAQSQFLEWIEDESNQDTHFDRNYIRHELTPVLEKRWPKIGSSIKTSTELLSKENELLGIYLSEELAQLLEPGVCDFEALNLEKWEKLQTLKQAELIRVFIKRRTSRAPSRNVLAEVMSNVIASKDDSQPKVVMSDFTIRRFKNKLYCEQIEQAPLPQLMSCSPSNINGNSAAVHSHCVLPEGSLYQGKRIEIKLYNSIKLNESNTLVVRWGQVGDKIQPNQSSGNKKVSELLKQLGCPAWLRSRVPLLYLNGELVAVVGYAIAYPFQSHIELDFPR